MNIKPTIALLWLLLATLSIASAQKKDTITKVLKQVDIKSAPAIKLMVKDTLDGTVTGTIKDSLHNYFLRSATVTIYNAKTNDLVGFQLTNNYGKFVFKKIPTGIPLKLVTSHLSYKDSEKSFIIPKQSKTIDIGILNVDRTDRVLKEVSIRSTVPPMQMRGDTLEFNAAAFKLEPNAVIEDLMRKLTGVTVWADGKITVNGREITSLLVDGKNFFGSNKIALQNIPKNSVEKIQVYQTDKTQDPATAVSEMNVVLKKDKKNGMFGKLGVGYGTNKHYQADAMVAYFSPKTQASIVGALNDVNKVANGVNSLMEFNSFKGDGINNDYHNDFRREGLNIYRGTGLTVQHDLNKETDARKAAYRTNMLKGEFFYTNSDNTTLQENNTRTNLANDGVLEQNGNSIRKSNNWGLNANANYNKNYRYGSLSASYSMSNNGGNSTGTQTSTSLNNQSGLQTQNTSLQNSNNDNRSVNLNVNGSTQRYYDPVSNRPKWIGSQISYSLHIEDNDRDSRNMTNFLSSQPGQDRTIDRTYATSAKVVDHSFSVRFRDLLRLIPRNYTRWSIEVANTLDLRSRTENNDVKDLVAGTTNQYQPNTGLTNKSDLNIIEDRPAINISRGFSKSFENRFYKYLSFNVSAQGQAFSQRNTALQFIQNIDRSYFYFIPTASINYSNDQYGDYRTNYSFSYNTSVTYPSIFQLAPLVDNSDLYNIPVANLALKPAYNHTLGFNYSYNSQVPKNDLNGRIGLSARLTERNIIDSVYYDNLNRTVRRYVNGKPSRGLNYNGSINKTYRFKDHQFQTGFDSGAGYDLYNNFVNGQDYDTRQASLNGSARVIYQFNSTWSGGLSENFQGSKTYQGDLNQLTYYTWTTNFGFAFSFPRSVFLNTRVNINNSKSSAQAENIYYTIWNADAGFRFFKDASGEIKISALDILHQNRALQNYLSNNTITQRTSNVLQQYFMLTLAYYPRKFGGKK